MTLSTETLRELRSKAEKASPEATFSYDENFSGLGQLCGYDLRVYCGFGKDEEQKCKETAWFYIAANPSAVLQLLDAVERLQKNESRLRVALELALSFAPKGPVPEGLSPMFYHTLNYADEVKLQERIDLARATLRDVFGPQEGE